MRVGWFVICMSDAKYCLTFYLTKYSIYIVLYTIRYFSVTHIYTYESLLYMVICIVQANSKSTHIHCMCSKLNKQNRKMENQLALYIV